MTWFSISPLTPPPSTSLQLVSFSTFNAIILPPLFIPRHWNTLFSFPTTRIPSPSGLSRHHSHYSSHHSFKFSPFTPSIYSDHLYLCSWPPYTPSLSYPFDDSLHQTRIITRGTDSMPINTPIPLISLCHGHHHRYPHPHHHHYTHRWRRGISTPFWRLWRGASPLANPGNTATINWFKAIPQVSVFLLTSFF